jgi:phosphoribosylformimino-5-aminoimidazole carboxamide ribotide isomerase
VRLYRGLKGTEEVYFENPINAMKFWINHGATRLHLVDLDKAWGSKINEDLLESIIKGFGTKVKLQVGGGIRKVESAVDLINKGIDRVVIGTLAVENPDSISELIKIVGPENVVIALDYRKNKIAINGWQREVKRNLFDFAKIIMSLGVINLLFSSVELDGTLLGPDFLNIKRMIKTVGNKRLYVAGGVRNEDDVQELKKIGVAGVIIGRALYENKISASIFQNHI